MIIKGPLNKVRVIDLSHAQAGPFGTQLLGNLGAEIIKIEPPEGDISRNVIPKQGSESYYFLALNHNKKSVVLDLHTESGKKVFYDLVKISDVVYDNYRVGVKERLGVDHETLKNINPRIISCSITGFGPSGPYCHQPAFDDNIQGIAGAISLCGEPGSKPLRSSIGIVDITAGILAALGLTAALYKREYTGKGYQVDINLLDTAFSLLQPQFQSYFITQKIPEPQGSRHPFVPLFGAFQTKDGYLILAPSWPHISLAINRADLIDDPRFKTSEDRFVHKHELDNIVEDTLRQKSTDYWLEIFRAKDIPIAPVNTLDKAISDPQVIHNKIITNMTHPAYGKIRAITCPIRIEDTEGNPEPPPTLGQHTEEVLIELLGYTKKQVKEMADEIKNYKKERRLRKQA